LAYCSILAVVYEVYCNIRSVLADGIPGAFIVVALVSLLVGRWRSLVAGVLAFIDGGAVVAAVAVVAAAPCMAVIMVTGLVAVLL